MSAMFPSSNNTRSTLDPESLLVEAERHLAVRDRVATTRRPSRRRLPASGDAALRASALIQAALGVEFTLSGLNKLADARYVSDFGAFVRSSPGASHGVLASLVQGLVLPYVAIFARLIEVSELSLGVILLVGALEIGRRRLSGRLGAPHGYEAPLALVASAAGLSAAALSLSIAVLLGEGLPTVMPGRAFTSAIPVELLIVPLGVAVAWLEFGRFLVLRRAQPRVEEAVTRQRMVKPVQAAAAHSR